MNMSEAEELRDLTLEEAFAPETEQETGVKEAEPEQEAAPEAEETPKAEEADSTPETETKEESWHITAVMDEREKRQKAQKEAEELRKEIEALKTGDSKDKTSVFENEEGFRNELLSEFDQQRINDRLNMSQALAERDFGKDKVAEAIETFRELANGNPEISNRFANAPLPYHEMMDIVEKHNDLKAMENVDEYKEKLRAELRQELEAEMKQKADADKSKREAITPSLASARSTGGNDEVIELERVEDVLPT